MEERGYFFCRCLWFERLRSRKALKCSAIPWVLPIYWLQQLYFVNSRSRTLTDGSPSAVLWVLLGGYTAKRYSDVTHRNTQVPLWIFLQLVLQPSNDSMVLPALTQNTKSINGFCNVMVISQPKMCLLRSSHICHCSISYFSLSIHLNGEWSRVEKAKMSGWNMGIFLVDGERT